MQVHSLVVSDIADIAGASQRFNFFLSDYSVIIISKKKYLRILLAFNININKKNSPIKYGDYLHFKT